MCRVRAVALWGRQTANPPGITPDPPVDVGKPEKPQTVDNLRWMVDGAQVSLF